MKVAYSPKIYITNIVIGIVWIVLGIAGIFMEEGLRWTDYASIFLGVIYLAYFFAQRTMYFQITTAGIATSGILKKSIDFTKAYEAYYFAGEYVFKQDKKEIRITTDAVAPKDVPAFKSFIETENLLTRAA